MKIITVIGLMSGTSLDGLDICAVNFIEKENRWQFDIIASETIKYSKALKFNFNSATKMSVVELAKFDVQIGELFGGLVKQFIISNKIKVDLIASHGHTIFHQPENGFTTQIGCGNQISNLTKLPVIFDFRSKDVSLGGQGAPLVPIGDKLLFSEFDMCINLGGIANVSFDKSGERIAYDICAFNMGLNYLANKLDLQFDDGGEIAKKGKLNLELFNQLENLNYFKMSPPKSLGIEWFNEYLLPLFNDSKISIQDKLNSFSQHIASQLAKAINLTESQSVLLTGGGVYNKYVIELLKSKTDKQIIIPNVKIIEFKEALIFAFLGVLRFNNQINVLKSVTGASKNSSSGLIVMP